MEAGRTVTWCEHMARLTVDFQIAARVKWSHAESPSDWGGLGCPVPSYLEPSFGPIPLREIEWVELDMTKRVYRGRLVPDLEIDASNEVIKKLEGLRFDADLASNIVRVFPYDA